MEIFVAAEVFHEQDLVVALPRMARYVAFGFVRQRPGLASRRTVCTECLDEDILAAGALCKER